MLAIKKKLKKSISALSILLLLILITIIGVRYYINSHKKEIATFIENVINDNSRGTVVFESIDIGSIKDLPNIKFQIHNVELVDSLYAQHNRKTIFLENVSGEISILDVLNNEIKINSFSAKKGQINIFTDEDHFTNSYLFDYGDTKKDKKSNYKFLGDDVDVTIEDVDFVFTEKIKNKRITAYINSIDFNINLKNLAIPTVDLDVFMNEMGLNLDNGTFFNNVRCVGSFHPEIDKVNKTFEVPEFPLKIGKQEFDVTAFINTKENRFKFLLSLEEANYDQSVSLLSENIASKLSLFDILNPFKVKAEISGVFAYKSNPFVKLEYATQKNEILYQKENIHLKDVTFNGSLRNRVFFDDRMKTESPKNLTVKFGNFSGLFKSIPFQLSRVTVINEFSKPLYLKTEFRAESRTKDLNDLIKSPDYKFTRGKFLINGHLNEYVSSLSDIFKSSQFHIESANLLVKSKHNANQFYLPYLEMDVTQNKAKIKEVIAQFNTNERAYLHGTIKNFSTFFIEDEENNPPVSILNISSDYINFNSLLQSFGAQKTQSQSKNLADVKVSFKTLAEKFNPHINFSLQRLDLSGTLLDNIKIKAKYEGNDLTIEEISGNYKDGNARAKLNIDLNPRKNRNNEETLFLNLQLEVNGKIEHWTEILKSEKFFFKNARYNLNTSFYGEAKDLKELIKKSKIVINVQEGSMLYKPTGLTLPFHHISLRMQDKNAYLNDFGLKLPNNQTIHLEGKLDNFIELFDNTENTGNVTSSIAISSKNIDFSNFVDAFSTGKKRDSRKNNVKPIIKDLNGKFRPSISLQIDTLTYKKVVLEKVHANMYFKDSHILNFNHVYCYYFNRKVTLDAQIDLGNSTQTHFSTNVTVEDVAIERLLKTFDNFGYAKLSLPTEVTGIIHAKGSFKGMIDDLNGVKINTIEANVDYNIKKLRVKNFEPLIDIGNILFRKERFEDLKFANVNNSLRMKNRIISLPQTNVQSTAFDLFIEGKIDNSIYTDLWISIPLSNIKRRDLSKTPFNKTFDEASRKVYLQIKADKNGKLRNKFHFRNKKKFKTKN